MIKKPNKPVRILQPTIGKLDQLAKNDGRTTTNYVNRVLAEHVRLREAVGKKLNTDADGVKNDR